ncbi:hypothetical protein TVAG_165650 [Trichomonas vaginalis G3]|uniref:Uncharacterized protein n=1 Tax=Trichomonas vaginalis (strain ATCC PRA-98 / G3) TaxID=412133 RepID=A2DUP6_TRIV3|nr:hypothetical protein TVAGG3_0662580 [Trichomonas vaginalis G3]EAY15937.1 hypothetical protein TVAG_165650 [Trichomonas vaginalis G3]KAI5506602.1 hypothetical protein TVAGG3_0662580 [Trichomonas vaginalis G3]|eukprot:XP_001328160.1 hypothetical protein [Trichomonas vaginalis G3]
MTQNIITDIDYGIAIDTNAIIRYIDQHSNREPFIIVLFFGQSVGKSTLIQEISGVQQEIGNIYHQRTTGEIITYGGHISDIYHRLNYLNNENIDDDLHVYFIEAEAINSSCPNEIIVEFLLPFCSLCTKFVNCIDKNPISGNAQIISLINKHLISRYNNREENQFFLRKLITFVRDIPETEDDIMTYNDLLQTIFRRFANSDIVHEFRDQGIVPDVSFGGKFNQRHSNKFLVPFVQKLFTNIDRNLIFESTEDFAAHIQALNYQGNFYIKFVNPIGTCDILEREVNQILNEFKELVNQQNIGEEQFIVIKNQKMQRFDRVQNENHIHSLKARTSRTKLDIEMDKIFHEKILKIELINSILQQIANSKFYVNLSAQVQREMQNAADYIFDTIKSRTDSISNYQQLLNQYVENRRNHCLQLINEIGDEEKIKIQNDINSVFDYLLTYHSYANIRQNWIFSSIARYFHDAPDPNPSIRKVQIRKIRCIEHTYLKRLQSIHVGNRDYLLLLRNIPNERKYFDIIASLQRINISETVIKSIINSPNPYQLIHSDIFRFICL